MVGLGQPFSDLLYRESEEVVLKQEDHDQAKRLMEMQQLAITTYLREQDWKSTRQELRSLEKEIKMERNKSRREQLQSKQDALRQKELLDARAFEEAYKASKKEKLNPDS